ncbi:hypothetical protein EXIGLDRAFT_135784 [Exidia glandulosa HHB12029]|uniref:F-box domain-containing protein n=1 Tax=Exidia glandulosa HHB12029 TaxID=1314781 RepID=A0A166BFZ6_EXIGL|nr:hypothetical protein EXIGLDRAFT_135784 [Exidia glandulosa HHB12029]
MSSLLHDVLRPNPAALDSLSDRLAKATLQRPDAGSDDEDELTSLPGTPGVLSRPTSRPTSRSSSPTRTGARSRLAPGPLKLAAKTPSSDPLKAFPTELGQRIFSMLSMRDLARCSRVSRKWNKSQTLNYVWFQHYRMDSFHDETLPPGKWTRRESKQNWRQTLMKALRQRSDSPPLSYSSRRASPPGSGYQTPKEVREEKWKSENEAVAAPSKNEMREIYKSLDGRKVKGKGKIGTTPRRDRGGWDNGGEDW